jgi:ureidoglycolate hydrolase
MNAQPITHESFADYGQAITPVGDLTPYSDHDAKLFFDGGPIRFYIMQLEHPGTLLKSMTRHSHCTQCLASADAEPWWLAVATPDPQSNTIAETSIRLFRVDPGLALKLHSSTWHAGPYFLKPIANFYNLELAHTKVTDHFTRPLTNPIELNLA